MKIAVLAAIALVLRVSTAAGADTQSGATAGASGAALAEKLVGQSAGIQQDDLVQINGTAADLPLLEDLAVAVRKRGAFPVITISSGTLARRMIDEVPAQFDSQVPQFDLKLAGLVTAIIGVEYPNYEQAVAGVSASRQAAVSKASAAPYQRELKRNVRMVSLGNGLYPTANRAALFGLAEAELRKIFEDALNVDYPQMHATADKLKGILSAGKQAHITGAGGTDLSFTLVSKSGGTSDGIITPEKRKKGGAACQVWLPAGEAFCRIAPGTAAGRVVFDHYYFEGQDCRNVVWTIKGGKITGITADNGQERLRAVFDAGAPGKDRVTILDLGINPTIRLAAGSRLRSYIPAGMITLISGDDTWAGGDVATGLSFVGMLAQGTLTVDGQTIVENGELKAK